MHAREEQRQEQEEDARLTEELQRLQELQKLRAVKKKKKERPSKDCPKLDVLAGTLQAAAEPGPDPAHMHNGSLEPTEEPETSPPSPSRHTGHTELGPGTDGDTADPGDPRDSKLLLPEGVSGKQQEPLSFLLDIMRHHKGGTSKQKPKQAGKAGSEPGGRPTEPPRPSEGQPRPRPQTEPKAKVLDLLPLVEPKREERKANSNNNNKKQLNHVKEGKASPSPTEPTCAAEHPHGSKLVLAGSPQPRGKSKKSRKKKGDRASSSLGKWARMGVCVAGACGSESIVREQHLSVFGQCLLQAGAARHQCEGRRAIVIPFCYFEIILDFPKSCKKYTISVHASSPKQRVPCWRYHSLTSLNQARDSSTMRPLALHHFRVHFLKTRLLWQGHRTVGQTYEAARCSGF